MLLQACEGIHSDFETESKTGVPVGHIKTELFKIVKKYKKCKIEYESLFCLYFNFPFTISSPKSCIVLHRSILRGLKIQQAALRNLTIETK